MTKQPTLAPEILPSVGKVLSLTTGRWKITGKNCQARCATYKQLGRTEKKKLNQH